MKLRPGFAIFVGSKFAAAFHEYVSSLHEYDSVVSCIWVESADEGHLERAFYNSVLILDAESIHKQIEQGLVPDDTLGQVSAFFFIDSDQIELLAATLNAFITALDRISFDVGKLHFVTVMAGPADREEAKVSCSRVHQVFGSVLDVGPGVQTAVVMLLPWFNGAPIQNRADLYRLAGFIGQLCSLSESDPKQSEFCQFKNAHFVGKTYIPGLRSYSVGNVNGAVGSFLLAAAWKRIGVLFQGQDIPSRKVLSGLIREVFATSLLTNEREDDPLVQLASERARKEYLPTFVSKLAGHVRTYSEFVQLIKLIAKETTEATNQGSADSVVAVLLMISTLIIPKWLLGIGICITIVLAFAMFRRGRRASHVANTQPEMPGSLPKNRLLNRVFEDFSASLPVETVNVELPDHRLSNLDLLPFQDCYNPSESRAGQSTAAREIVNLAADIVSLLFVVTRDSEWILASKLEPLNAGLKSCQSAVEAAIYADFVSWVQNKQSVAGSEQQQHRWLFSERMPIKDIRCFEFRPEALVSDCSEASLVQRSINFLYLVPTEWN